MVYCENCGDPLAYQVTQCTKCGAETKSAPRAIAGKNGLDPRRLAPGQDAQQVEQQASAQSGGSGSKAQPREAGTVDASLAGTYEYVKPGSFEKSVQTLVLRADGSCSYSEEGHTSMEDYTTSGDGQWDCSGGVLRVVIRELVRDTKFKTQPLVKGIKEGRSSEYNITVPITESEIVNATNTGTNKWRRKN